MTGRSSRCATPKSATAPATSSAGCAAPACATPTTTTASSPLPSPAPACSSISPPIAFGGYSATLKKAVDHQIQNILPFFTTLNSETHHARRYDHYADLLVIGWQPASNPVAEGTFRHLARRNSLNFYAQASQCESVTGGPSEQTLVSQLKSALEAIARRQRIPQSVLPEPAGHAAQGSPPRRALLLVGSPRGRQSTSHSIGDYLMQQLAARRPKSCISIPCSTTRRKWTNC